MKPYRFALPVFILCFCLFPAALVAAPAALPAAGFSMFWAIISIFFGGMALNLTPCVYPLVPITISYFSGESMVLKPGRGAIVINALLYVLGIAVTNSMLGVFAALSGRLLGTLLQNPITLVLVALVMFLFALSMFGVWEFRLPSSITGAAARNYAGYLGSLFMGLTLGVVAAPCIGPFIVGVLVMVANSRDPVYGFWIFFSLSLGMGFPLFVLALLSGRLSMLPKSGEWMLWVRKAMGWVMIGAAGYFIFPIMPGILGAGLLSVIALAAGVHLGWIGSAGGRSAAFKWIRTGVGIVCICLAGAIIWYAMPGEAVKWTPYSAKALEQAKESGKPVILDFYADWCPGCRHMDRITFHERSIIKAAAKDFVMIKVDFSQRGDRAKESLAHSYNIPGIPCAIFLKPGGEERVELRVSGIMPPGELLARMNRLKNGDGSADTQ
ncbi:Cytochrome c biogenesis protein transmembrane region [Syntrophobacter sp. SbD2]|nr:Cytochrome c biogenesis protein transmembrane region [Syntrophobacter sp. SbD2]